MFETVLFTRQKHDAEKAGLHYDYRIVVGDKAYSWATKKETPETGKSIILWEQPVHNKAYALSEKVIIPKGQYGAGVTTLDWVKKGKASIEEGKIVVEVPESRFLLKKLPEKYGEGAWLFRNLEKTASTIPELYSEASKNKWLPELLNQNPKLRKIPINHEGETVGFISIDHTSFKGARYPVVDSIYITPEHRNKGLASSAVLKVFPEGKGGIAYIEPENKVSIKTFEKAGFSKGPIIIGGTSGKEYIEMMKVHNKYLDKIAEY